MSTYFFKTYADTPEGIRQHMEKLEQSKDIERWRTEPANGGQILEIETLKMSPEQVKHYLRESGIEAEFTRAPQA